MIRKAILFSILFTTFISDAKNPCQFMDTGNLSISWGTGGIYFPIGTDIAAYNENKELIGRIERPKGHYLLKITYNKHSCKTTSISGGQVNLGKHGCSVLKAQINTNNQYFNIPWKDTDESNLLIKAEDLEAINGEYCNYHDLLHGQGIPTELEVGRKMARIGINLEQSCLNLRKAPSPTATKVVCIPSDDFGGIAELRILEWQRNWAKVQASICDPRHTDKRATPYGCDCEVEETTHYGWVKAIDDSGFPNIWFTKR